MVKKEKWAETVWLFYEIVGKVKFFWIEDQGEKDASDFKD